MAMKFDGSLDEALNAQSDGAGLSYAEILAKFHSLLQRDIVELGSSGATAAEIDRAFEYLADIQWRLVETPARDTSALTAKSIVLRDLCDEIESSVASALGTSLCADIARLFSATGLDNQLR